MSAALIPKLKPVTASGVEACGHVLRKERIAGVVTFQAAADQRLTSHGTVLCERCALAVSEAVMAAVMTAWAESQEAPR